MTRDQLAKLVELTEAGAYADMFRAAPPEFGMSVQEFDDCVGLFAPAIDIMLFNRVMGLGLHPEISEKTVRSIVMRYREAGLKNFAVQLSPEARASQVPEWLSDENLSVRDYWTKVYCAANSDIAIETDLKVQKIDKSLAQLFAHTACDGFGMPHAMAPIITATVGRSGWHHYVAWDGASPAAVAALFVKDHTGWLGIAATVPAQRRKGAQGALMARRIRDSVALGCKWLVTETGKDLPERPNPSFHNMMRAGFVVAYDRPNFMPNQ
jgi:hypothetical protein